MSEPLHSITIIGGGLAGSEAALWLASKGISVQIIEQKPEVFSPAHSSISLAELVCSNSFKAEREDSASGLLKAEMRMLGSSLLPIADSCKVPAGGALAVDREAFAQKVTELVATNPNIQLVRRQQETIDAQDITIIASGPLTGGELAQNIKNLTGGNQLAFYDAAAPIVTAASLDMGRVFEASRYGKGDPDYLNCPFDKEGYEAFYEALINGESAPRSEFDGPVTVYEGCMPVEIMAKRGPDTLRFGPLRPVGLTDPATGHRPWANVQLRKENIQGGLYNLVGFQTSLKFGEQDRIFRMIPGLENAEFARYGVMHRNSFINSPKVLTKKFSLANNPKVFFAGQITGFEGYMESAACGLMAARSALALLNGRVFNPPPVTTMCGALANYIVTPNEDFQPMGSNMGLLPPLDQPVKGKWERYGELAARAKQAMSEYLRDN